MEYDKWLSNDGTETNLKDMTIAHIRNCISLIIRSINPNYKNEGKKLFDELWLEKHAKNYLDAFYNELIIRGKTP